MRTGWAVLVLLATTPALADQVGDARAHFERASAAYALGHFGDAADEYEKAFALKPDPALLYDAAQAHRAAGNKQRALLLYQNYLRVFGDGAPNADEVNRHIAELKLAIAKDESQAVPRPSEAKPTPPARVDLIASPAKAPPKPLVKKAWFWVTIVGAAAVGATAIGLGVTLGSSTHYPAPSQGLVRGN